MALHLIALSHRYGRQRVLDEVTLNVPPGACYGFLGHNGAGKTTAMRIALGLIRPDSGRVLVDGFDIAEYPREARARMGGLIETPGFFPGDDGLSNLRWLARLQGLSSSEARVESKRVFDLLGLERAGKKPVRAYSQGMRQRLGIAQAILGRPRYVLLDEPTNGLDPEGIAEIRRILADLARNEGQTILLSSHQLGEISGLCARIGVLRQGKLLLEADTKDLLDFDRRYVIETDRPADAAAAVETNGYSIENLTSTSFDVRPGEDRDIADAAAAVVSIGARLRGLTPRALGLEQVYLECMKEGGAKLPHTRDVAPEPAPPRERIAPRSRFFVLWCHEIGTVLRRPGAWLLLLLPLVIAGFTLKARLDLVAADRELIAAGKLKSATEISAFEVFASCLQNGLPLLLFVIAGFASQAVAADYGRGTLRHLLFRPLSRFEIAASKAMAVVGITTLAYLLLAGTSLFLASRWFEFGDIADILPNGKRFVITPAEKLWPGFRSALELPILALLGYSGLGFLIGTILRNATAALAASLGACVVLELLRVPGRTQKLESWLLSAHLPSPLSDTTVVRWFVEMSQGKSNAAIGYMTDAVTVPLLWCAATFLGALLLILRRSYP